jgi:hypothetical protein
MCHVSCGVMSHGSAPVLMLRWRDGRELMKHTDNKIVIPAQAGIQSAALIVSTITEL